MGDADAFGQLYEIYVDRIYRYFAYRISLRSDAEDLTESVFLRAWEAMPRYEQRGLPYGAWLYRLARNMVVDHYRAQKSDVSLSEIHDEGPNPIIDPDETHQIVQSRIEAEEVRSALSVLNEDQCQVVVLRFIEGLSHNEVAQLTNKTENATRAIQYRALQTLARALSKIGSLGHRTPNIKKALASGQCIRGQNEEADPKEARRTARRSQPKLATSGG